MNEIWKHIFSNINYNGDSEIIITANTIKNCKNTWFGNKNQFEPRLLCKQDTTQDIPEIFKEYKINIIPIKNGEYLLTKTNIYHELNYKYVNIIKIENKCKSDILKIGYSESSLIDKLRYNGVFEREEILNEPILYGSLLNGRHRCKFNTFLSGNERFIDGVQYETDACYES